MPNSKVHIGRCQCNVCSYTLEGEPLTCYCCHCTDCQAATGSAFTMSMIIHESQVVIEKGELEYNQFDHKGTILKRTYCNQCGSALWFSAEAHPGVLALKPGTLIDKTWFKPVAHVWLSSAPPWLKIEDNAKKYQAQPKMSELIDLWQQQV